MVEVLKVSLLNTEKHQAKQINRSKSPNEHECQGKQSEYINIHQAKYKHNRK